MKRLLFAITILVALSSCEWIGGETEHTHDERMSKMFADSLALIRENGFSGVIIFDYELEFADQLRWSHGDLGNGDSSWSEFIPQADSFIYELLYQGPDFLGFYRGGIPWSQVLTIGTFETGCDEPNPILKSAMDGEMDAVVIYLQEGYVLDDPFIDLVWVEYAE